MTEALLEAQWASLLTSLAAHRPVDPGVGEVSANGSATTTPVTLMTGFLGAGKSTLLADLLAHPGGVGVVRAVVNDVGRLAFDPTLVAAADDTTVELANGCGCCVAGSAAELGQTLEQVSDGADLVVLEASGLADPSALAQIAEARTGLTIDRVVAVVDARSLERLLDVPDAGPILRRQLACATVVVLSHGDGLSPSALEAVERLVATLAPGCPVEASSIERPASWALGPAFPAGAGLPLTAAAPSTEVFVTETLDQERPLTRAVLEAVLDESRGLLRGKGRLILDGNPTLVQFTTSVRELRVDAPGPTGLTVVAEDRRALDPLTHLLTGRSSVGRPDVEPSGLTDWTSVA